MSQTDCKWQCQWIQVHYKLRENYLVKANNSFFDTHNQLVFVRGVTFASVTGACFWLFV